MTSETVISIFLGVGLAASAGFRVFLPLFALSLAGYFGVWELNANWQWIGSLAAVLTLGIATVVEVFAYFIPWVDNALDSIAIPLAAVAGTTAKPYGAEATPMPAPPATKVAAAGAGGQGQEIPRNFED